MKAYRIVQLTLESFARSAFGLNATASPASPRPLPPPTNPAPQPKESTAMSKPAATGVPRALYDALLADTNRLRALVKADGGDDGGGDPDGEDVLRDARETLKKVLKDPKATEAQKKSARDALKQLGNEETDQPEENSRAAKAIASMGTTPVTSRGIVRERRGGLVLDTMTPEQARAHLALLDAEEAR